MSQAGQTTSGYLEVNGARLAYEVAGDGPTVVLCHAGIADMRMWDAQLPALARRYRVIRYDQRGYGRSSLPPAPYSHSDDLYSLLQALGVARAVLVGVSMGGGLVIDVALRHPEMVRALVVVAPGVRGFDWDEEEEAPFAERIEAAMQAGDLDRANEVEVQLWVDGPRSAAGRADPAVRERVREMNGALYARLDERRHAEERPVDPPPFGRLEEIRVPVLAIIGDEDLRDLHRLVDVLTARVPGARRVEIAGTAHVPNMERPEEFNRIVLEFLNTVED
jgi:3-oxoadipate enol-lactonase